MYRCVDSQAGLIGRGEAGGVKIGLTLVGLCRVEFASAHRLGLEMAGERCAEAHSKAR